MRWATYKIVNMQQHWGELDSLTDNYPAFAAESDTVQQETVDVIREQSGGVRLLAWHTDARLIQAWTEGCTLHQRVCHLEDQL